MGFRHFRRREALVTVIWTAAFAPRYASPQQAPVPGMAPKELAMAPTPGVATGSQNAVVAIYPLQGDNFTQLGLPGQVLFGNVTYRFTGEDLTVANGTFRNNIESAFHQFVPPSTGLTVTFQYRPGVGATIIGPDGMNGSGIAYAPTPGMVPELGGLRRLMQAANTSPFTKQTFENRYTVYQSIDVEVLGYGGASGSLVDIKHPVQLNGFLEVLMSQQSISVQALPINISDSCVLLPVVQQMNLGLPTSYALGTVLQAQSMLLLALASVIGSQESFLYNRIHKIWSDEANDTVRAAVITYTNQLANSLNEIAGGDVPTLMTQVAQAAGQNFSVSVVSSVPLGTQAQELSGDPIFDLDPTAGPAPNMTAALQGAGDLSGGVIAGIVVGVVVAVIVLCCFAVLLVVAGGRKHLAFKATAARRRAAMMLTPQDLMAKNMTGEGQPPGGGSSGLTASKGGSFGEYSSAGEGKLGPHPLSEAWNINPADLAVCQLPDGRDWLLGTGSFGQVYRGVRGGVQDVAIKQLIKPGNLHLRMFEKEIALLRHLNYDRNLVQFLGACVADNNLMLVLELCEGGDLKDALGNDHLGKFGWYKHGANVLMDIARGLHFLHTNKVAHRDLKTKNILLTRAGEAKIGDVGLAKLVGSQLLSTQLDTAGTFTYAAPELLLGETCDQSADIYSFGVIMWEVVTHEIPVRGALRTIDVPQEAPEEVAGLIEACLQRNAKARPTAKEIFDTLQELLAQPPSKLPPLVESGESKVQTDTTTTVDSMVKTGTTEEASELEQPSAKSAGESTAVDGLLSTASTVPPRLHSA